MENIKLCYFKRVRDDSTVEFISVMPHPEPDPELITSIRDILEGEYICGGVEGIGEIEFIDVAEYNSLRLKFVK